MKHPNDWSPGGRFLIFDDHHLTQRQDLWLLPMDGIRKPQPLLVTPADETLAQFSPDGRWVLYRSDESGRSEIYLRDFAPDRSPAVGDQKWTLSRDGGDKPRWSADGRAVFYIGRDRMMTKVPLVIAGMTVQPGAPVPLFEVNPVGWTPYDVTPDGRFLVTSVVNQEGQPSVAFNVVLNWPRALQPLSSVEGPNSRLVWPLQRDRNPYNGRRGATSRSMTSRSRPKSASLKPRATTHPRTRFTQRRQDQYGIRT